ncbi:MAG: D-Ala-D-Ala dipeptidase [Alphaproteobacteria bacterium]|nr:D-Ala-D-Ala dipeptidase [Alphaproteobacteria bacterium]
MTEEPIPITAADLVALDDYVEDYPLKIDLVYAQPDHPDNIFKTGIYRPDARMWGHRDFVPVILRAAMACHAQYGYTFELKDCLRTCEAQAAMAQTDIVKANPHWLREPNRLLSPPGKGGHPRGMAVDIILLTEAGEQVEMGTSFDYLTPDRASNPAARDYTGFSDEILANRVILESAMMRAAADLGHELLPLPAEWWDFRFMPAYTNKYAPVFDADLPEGMRMTS